MKLFSRTRTKASLTAAGLLALAAVVNVISSAPASAAPALADCLDNHICFYESFHDDGTGNLSLAGSQSDQSSALIDHQQTISVPWEEGVGGPTVGTTPPQAGADGKIADFHNSHYTNGDSLNDSVSSIVNNSNHCLFMFGDSSFIIPPGHDKEGIEMGPHSTLFLVGATFGDVNDKLSSAYTIAPGNAQCTVPDGGRPQLAIDLARRPPFTG